MDSSDYNNAPASQVSAELTARFVALEQQQSHSNQQQQQLLQLVMTNQQQLQQLLEARQSFPHQQPPASTELPAEQQGPPIRLPVPRFEGKVPALADLTSVSEVDDVEIFIARMSSYFRACRTPTYAQLAVLENALAGPAAAWYWGLVRTQDMPTTWMEMAGVLRARFEQPSRIRAQQRAFFEIRQEERETVAAYTARLQLLDAATPGRAEVDRVEVFLRGLRPVLQLDARKHAPLTLSAAVHAATASEQAAHGLYQLPALGTAAHVDHDPMILDTVRGRIERPSASDGPRATTLLQL
ncbi:hypothetical protein RI367_008829 [Sorochytrium milnesiophthora]